MRKNMLAIGYDSEPTKHALELLDKIKIETEKLQVPDNWIFRKVWKAQSSGTIESGEVLFKANSWVMEFYINHSLYEQFSVHDISDLYEIDIAKKNLMKKIEGNPDWFSIPPKEKKTRY